jgi:hypothetical protein
MKRKDNTGSSEQRIPIPPLSVVRVAYAERNSSFRKLKGQVFRVGYYNKRDGLDCIWLVNDAGRYEQTVDHKFLYRHFDVINFAEHNNLYGRQRPKLPPICSAAR